MFEPGNYYGSYSTGVISDKISTLQLRRRREVNGRLCIIEVGVDLEFCGHAHRHDVDLIIRASIKLIIPLVQVHLISGIWPFAIVVPTMFLLDSISRASLSTCLLQSNTLVQPLL